MADNLHDCSMCRGCELKPGCKTDPDFGCQGKEKARRAGLPPPCRLCGEPTTIVFNIRLKAVPVCQACASAITRQEVVSLCGTDPVAVLSAARAVERCDDFDGERCQKRVGR